MTLGLSLLALTVAGYGAAPQPAVVKSLAYSGNGESLDVRIDATGPVRVAHFELDNPRRLVVDFLDIQSTIAFKEKSVRLAGVERIRTSFFTDDKRQATRIVFDLSGPAPYVIDDDGAGHVRVAFGRASSPATAKAAPAPLTVRELGAEPIPAPELFLSEPPSIIAQVAGMRDALLAALALKPGVIPSLMPAALPGTPKETASPEVKMALTAVIPTTPIPDPMRLPGQAAQQPAAPQGAQTPQYSGEIISLDLKDVDLKDFFRLISDISGLNVVLDPNVGGILTIMLKEVPWDQALDVVLKNYQLGAQLNGNILRIASNATLAAEESAKKAIRDAQEAATELETRTYRLNYAKVDAVRTMLQRMLTSRGQIVEAIQKNTLFVTDVPANFVKIEKMVLYVDSPAQQVEIEARLLMANKSFSRDIGTQLAFLFNANHGNMVTGGTGIGSPFTRTPAPRVTAGGGDSLPLATNFPAAATSGLAFLMQPGGDLLLDSIITLAEARGTAKTISRPKITTQNNKAATIQQGTQIPVQTSVNNTVSTQFITFALKLTVTPQITEANTIILDVAVENSQPDFGRTVGVGGIPSVSTQQATTQVLIPDGGTAAIGGILVDQDSLTVSQVPGLGSIPVVGFLFKGTKTLKSTGELLFFVTARIRPLDVVEASR
jgi:type IV pilus assembly protein PilQ